MDEIKRSLSILDSNSLIYLLQNDYNVFGEPIKPEYEGINESVLTKRLAILEILMERSKDPAS